MSKNIVIVFSAIGKGGAERMVAYLANHLVTQNFNITIISLGREIDYGFLDLSPAIDLLHFTRTGKADFSAFTDIRNILQAKGASTVLCIDFFAQLYMSLLRRSKKFNFDIVLNVHQTLPVVKKDYLINFLGARFLRSTDYIIFISDNQQRYLSSRFLLTSPCKKALIYNGIDTALYKIAEAQKRLVLRSRLLGITTDQIVIIKVAGIRAEKDHEIALKALRYFIDEYGISPLLVFAGDGDKDLTAHLKQITSNLTLTANVKFTGFTQNVKDYLACADLFTLTSNSVETFSLAALEAMACGLPAVLTDIGGASEMLNADLNGLLSQPGNFKDIAAKWHLALSKNYDHDAIRDYVVKNFDVAKMNSQYQNLLNTLT